MNYRFALFLVLACALASAHAQQAPAAPASAQTPVTAPAAGSLETRIAALDDLDLLTQLVAKYRSEGDLAAETAALDRRTALRPHIGAYQLDKAVTLAREGRKSEAYTLLIELQGRGYAYDLRKDPRFAGISDTPAWGYIVDNLDANRAPFGEGKLAYTLPREDLLIESLAWDPSRKQLLVGSAREGKVYIVGKDGKLTVLAAADADNGMWAVFDLVVDAKRGFLWVASTAVPHFKGYKPEQDLGRAGIFKFDLKTGKFIKGFQSPVVPGETFFLSSIALGKDGEVYAADGVNNALYQVRDDQFRRILHAPMLSSIRALAVSGDGKSLYLADYERGIIGIELATLKPFDVRVPVNLTLEGLDSLQWFDGSLVTVQGGMNPPRVMRLGLSADGRTIAKVVPLEANSPLFDVPGLIATGDGSSLYLIGNSQKDNYDRFGLLRSKEKLEGTRILKLDADFAPPQLNIPGIPPR